ncbi:MAG: hypothetical protein ACOCQR_03555 [bacterium]
MFDLKEKENLIKKEKQYQRKGKEDSHYIGKIVKIDWDIKSKHMRGVNSPSELSEDLKKWVEVSDLFVITDVTSGGLGFKVELDHRFHVSPFRVYEPNSDTYLCVFDDINGDGTIIGTT